MSISYHLKELTQWAEFKSSSPVAYSWGRLSEYATREDGWNLILNHNNQSNNLPVL